MNGRIVIKESLVLISMILYGGLLVWAGGIDLENAFGRTFSFTMAFIFLGVGLYLWKDLKNIYQQQKT
jgi:hypothetical protein